MCGIVGYVGCNPAPPILLHGLEKLEYRGYDSAGIAVNNDEISVIKSKGKVENLTNMLINMPPIKGTCGIGHTRWATHGEPSDLNSHPHYSENKNFCIVHNGIIENYIELKEELIENGKKFVSDTDTEVIVQMIEYMYNGNFLETVRKVTKRLKGSFAFAVLSKYNREEIIAVRKDSPLIIGVGENENFLASDIPALLNKTRNIIRLEDNELAVLTPKNIEILNFLTGEKVKKEIVHIDWNTDEIDKCGYDHFMQKEIMEQPKVIKEVINTHIKKDKVILDEIKLNRNNIDKFNKVIIVGCGSAYNAGCVGRFILEDLIKKPVDVELASEFRYRNPIIDDKTLIIAISQSGETADTLAALRHAKSKKSYVLSIVNVEGSSIANESDDVIYTLAGPEIAVATTKAYSAQLAIIYLFAIYIAQEQELICEKKRKLYIHELLMIPEKINETLKLSDKIEQQAYEYFDSNHMFFMGRNIDCALSQEGSLKLKEISYIASESYAAGELKHGTISLIEYKTLVIAIATNSKLFDKMISNIKEVKARDAFVLSITTKKHKNIESVSDCTIYIPDTIDLFAPLLAVIPLQLFSYYVALKKGCNIDKPRNLAKSVTVE